MSLWFSGGLPGCFSSGLWRLLNVWPGLFLDLGLYSRCVLAEIAGVVAIVLCIDFGMSASFGIDFKLKKCIIVLTVGVLDWLQLPGPTPSFCMWSPVVDAQVDSSSLDFLLSLLNSFLASFWLGWRLSSSSLLLGPLDLVLFPCVHGSSSLGSLTSCTYLILVLSLFSNFLIIESYLSLAVRVMDLNEHSFLSSTTVWFWRFLGSGC